MVNTQSVSTVTIRAALEAFGIDGVTGITPVADSVSNQNFRVECAQGPMFLRAHRASRTLERIGREQAAAAWASTRGMPGPIPLRSPSGESVMNVARRLWSIHRWIEGRTLQRGHISESMAAKLGAIHGRCLTLLADYPMAGLPANSELTWSTEATIKTLRDVGPHVRERGSEQEKRWHAKQSALLESSDPRPSSDFDWLPVQATHGDFHERNVIFDEDGNLAALVDWERFCLQPPIFEVLRAVSFMLLLDKAPLRAYLEGLRDETQLAPETVFPGVDAWWQSSLHNTWVFRDYFLDGNEAARQFLPEEEGRSERFNDPAFRKWLAKAVIEHGC